MDRHAKKVKPRSRLYETVPNVKQRRIGPPSCRAIRDKHPTWSAPKMRQQTITQMDALRDYYHPDLEDENLQTDDGEEANSYVASPTRSKRRRIIPEKPQTRRIETRSLKRQAAKEGSSIQDQCGIYCTPSAGLEAEPHKSRLKNSTAMPSPKTPTSLRRKEIPSSQSPADTPLSTQSRQYIQPYTRSPLKERSTNIDLPRTSPIKRARWSERLKVADSMETDDEGSPVSVRIDTTTKPVASITSTEDLVAEGPKVQSHASSIHVADFNQRLEAAQKTAKEIQDSSQTRPRYEVIDSTDDEDDDEEAEAFNAGPETQAALANNDVAPAESNRPPKSTPPTTSKSLEDRVDLAPIQSNVSESPDTLNIPTPPFSHSSAEIQLPMPRPKRVDFVDIASSDPPGPSTPSDFSERKSDSKEVSAQLFADLHRETQPGGPQTESQFEKGWSIYTPVDEIHLDLEPLPSVSPKPIEQPSSGLMTVPTQFLRPPISSPPKYYKAPVPPSQATTVDLTQPSPRNMSSPSQAIVTRRSPRKSTSPSEVYPSSPPPIPPPSSSPLENRKVDLFAGYVWNGVRLTDSQLLPLSLLNDSEAGPPAMSQESWNEELE